LSDRRKITAAIAIILTLALLAGGVFAFTDLSQDFINRFRGGNDNDVLLHDDFEPGVNKDVYVENTGETEMIVRVKFTEYLQIGNEPIIGTDPDDKSTWELHLFPNTALVSAASYTGTEPQVVGNEEAIKGEFDGACSEPPHNYFAWVMSGAEKVYKPGTGEAGNDSFTIGQEFADGATAKLTLAANAPITMAEYTANREVYDAETAGRWILDTDGWCYWSKYLAPHTATNLLLDNVITTAEPDDNYYYAIDVILEAANLTEAYKLDPPDIYPDEDATVEIVVDSDEGGYTNQLAEYIAALNVGDTFSAAGYSWLIIAKEDDKVEVWMNEYAESTARAFNTPSSVDVHWAESDARAWLNGTSTNTLSSAPGAYEGNGLLQQLAAAESDFTDLITLSEISTETNLDPAFIDNTPIITYDKLFLISRAEANALQDQSWRIIPHKTNRHYWMRTTSYDGTAAGLVQMCANGTGIPNIDVVWVSTNGRNYFGTGIGYRPLAWLDLDGDGGGEIHAGDTLSLTAIVTPPAYLTAHTPRPLHWYSSDTAVATVDEDGLFTAVGAGTVTITAKLDNGNYDTVEITVAE
jgi:hypothetical protein